MANITDEMFLASLNGAGNVDYGAHEISDGGGDGFLDSLNGGSVDNVDASHQPKTATTDPHSLGFVERHGTESAAQTGVDLDEVYGTNGIGGVLGGTAKALNSVAPFAGTAGRAIAGSRQKSLDTALETGEAGSLSAIDTDEWDKTEGAKYDLYQRALNGDKDADYSPIYAQRFDKKSGRYVIDRDENGNPYLNEKYSGSKDEARKAFVKELAASQIAQTAETKYRAQKDLENNTAPWYMGLAHGATASLGFAGEFYLGGALAKGVLGAAALSGTKLGTAAKIAEAGGKLGLKGRMALSATELAAPTVANAIARYENLTADDYRMDDNGNVNLAERGDGAIKGAMKAAGGAAFENVVEVALGKMVNKVFGATCKGIYNKVPGIKKLFDGAMDKVGDKAVDSAKKAWIRATKTYAEVQKAAHFELMPVGEFAEEYVQGYGDEVLGLDVRDDADAKGLGEFTKDFFSWDANGKDLFYGVMGQTIALGLGTHAMRRAHDFKNSVDAKVLGALKLHGYNNADIAKMGTNTRLALAMQLSDGNAVKEMGYSVQDYADMLGVKQREVEKYGENIKLISNKEEFGKLTPEQQAKISGEVLQFQQVMYAAASSFEVGIDGATEMMNGLNKRMRKYIMLMEERQGLGNYRNNVGTKPQDFVSRVDWSGSTDSAGNINWQTDENTGRQYIESVPFSNDGFGVRVFREGDKFRVVHPQGMNQNGYLADDLKEAHDYAASLDQFAQKRNKDREIMQEYVRFNANRLVPTQTDKKTGKKIGAPVVTVNNAMDAVNNLGWLTENDKTKLAAAAQDGTEGGGFKTEDGTVLILLDNLRDTNDALLTLAHEIGGHAAIAEGAKDKGLSLAETIAEVYKTSKTKDTKQAQTEYRIRRTEGEDKNVARAAAQEEGMVYGNEYRMPVASPLQKAKTAVKLWMKQHGMDAKLTDDDYIAIASSGLARIEQTRTGDTGTESVDDNGITVTPTVRGTDLKNKHESGKWVSDYYAQREKLDEARAAQDAAEAAKRNADAAAKEQAKIDKAVADEEERQRKIAEAEQMRKDAEHATKYGREMVADVLNGWYGSKGIKPEQVERIVNGATNEEIAELLDFIELEMDGKASEGSVLEVAKKINKDIAGRTVSDKQKAQREKFAKSAKEKAANERRMKEQFIEDMGLQNSVFEYYWLENHGALFSEPVLKKVESKGVKFADRKADYYTYGNDGLDILFDGLHGNARLRMRRFLFGSGTQSQYDPAAFKAGLSTDDRPHGGIDLEIEALIKYVTGDIDADVSSHRYFNNVVDIVADLNDQNDKYQQWLKGEIGPEAEARYEQWRIDEERRIELEAAEVDNVDLADAHEAWGDVVAVSADGKPIADPSALKSGDGILVPNEDGVDVALRVVSNENGIIKIADESGAETFDFEWNKERGDWEAVEERDDANDYADEIDEFYESKNKEDGNGETNEELDEGGQDGDSAENTGLPEPQAAERDTGTAGGKDRGDGRRTEASPDNATASEDDALTLDGGTAQEIAAEKADLVRQAVEADQMFKKIIGDKTIPQDIADRIADAQSRLNDADAEYKKAYDAEHANGKKDRNLTSARIAAHERQGEVFNELSELKRQAIKAIRNGGGDLKLESATADDIAAEQKRVADRKEIERRQNAPLKSGMGEVGQSLMDLGGAEGEDLFNRTGKWRRDWKSGDRSDDAWYKLSSTRGIGDDAVRKTWSALGLEGAKRLYENDAIRTGVEGQQEKVNAQSAPRWRRTPKGEEPKKTANVYKLMRLVLDRNGNPRIGENGKPLLQTLYIGREDYEVGQWYDGEVPNIGKVLADEPTGYAYLIDGDDKIVERKPVKGGGAKISGLPSKDDVLFANSANARWITKTENAKGKPTYANVGINGSEGVTTFAMRPGIHAGSLPSMQQIGVGEKRNLRADNLVWVRGRVDYDPQYESVVKSEGGEINDRMPEHGYVKGSSSFVTKGMAWYISPKFIADEIISDQEAERVMDEFNRTRDADGEDVGYDYPRANDRRFYADTMKIEPRRKGDTTDHTKHNVSALMKKSGERWNADMTVGVPKSLIPKTKDAAGKAQGKWRRSAVTTADDAAYMDAVKRGDMETAQRMVREAAAKAMPNTMVVDKDGLPLVVYHGSESFNPNDISSPRVFNLDSFGKHDNGWLGKGFYFTPSKYLATRYSFGKGYVTHAFLDIKNPFDADQRYFFDGMKGGKILSENRRTYLSESGYDGVRKEGGYGEYVAFYPSQIKSADPVTYDDNGNVIPLSERFNPEKSDIRWRRRYTPDPLARRLADIRTLSTLVNGTDHMTEADRLRLSRLSSAILMRTEKMMRELQQQGSVSPELRDILTKARSNKPSEKISGIRSALFSTHGLSRIRERLQDAQISLLEMERALGIDLANSAYYQFDRNFGKVAKAMKDLERKIIKPLADEIRKNDIDTDELNLYLLALHGAERNRMIAERSPYVLAALNDPRTAPIVQKILAGTGGKTELNEQDILNISTILGWVDKNGNRTEDSKQFEKDLMGSGATTAWWNEKLADFNKSGFDAKAKKAVDLIRELTKMNRDLLVQSGRLNAKQAALWEKLSPNYVPMRSDMDMDTDIWGKWLLGGGAESNNGGRKYTNEEYKHAYGRGTIADDPISFAIQQYEESLGRAWDNVARQRLADIVRANPNIGKVFRYENLTTTKRARYAKAIAIIENKVKNETATPDEIKRMNWYREALNADGSIPTTKVLGQNGVMHTVPTLSAIEGSGKKSTNIIAFKEDGNLKFIKLGGFKQDQINANPNLLDDVTAKRIAAAVKKHNMAQINGLMRAMRKATGYFSALRTALSPTFVVSNLGADNTQALRNIYATFGAGAMTKFEHYAYHSFGAAKAVLNDNYNGTAIQKYAEEWADNGGMIGGLAVENIKDLRKGVDGIVRRLASQKNQIAKIHDIKSFLAWAKDRGSDFADFAEKYNSIVEMSTRIAAYATARDMGKSIEEAVSYARDITVNFNRKGTETPWINALYAFSNATMQDIQRSIVAFSEGEYGKGTGLLAKRGAIMSVGLMFLGFMASLFGYWQDDPEDEKEGKGQWKYAKEYQKQNVMGARVMGKTIGVPIRGLSRIPYYLGHQIYEAMTGRKSAASLAADTASLAVENMTDFLGSSSDIGQTLIPSVARPYFEIKNNKTFTGSPMYREALPGQEETAVRSEMGRGGTSDAAKWVAKMLNAATGGSKYERGTIDVQPEKIAAVWNWLFGSAGKDIANISGFVMDTATGKLLERDIRNVPYLSRFVRNLDENSADFYKARDKYEIALKKFNGMTGEDGNEDAVRELVADNPWLSTRGSGKRWGTELKDLNGAVQKLLQIEKGLDGEEYDNIHQLRLKAQYQFMRRLEKSPSEDAEGVSAEREHKKAYAPLLRSSKRDSKQEQREQKKRKRLF